MLERHDINRQQLRGFPEARLRQRIARTQVLADDRSMPGLSGMEVGRRRGDEEGTLLRRSTRGR